jgi:hypothetical protein
LPYNDRLALDNRKIGEAAVNFRGTLEPLLRDVPDAPDVGAVRTAHEKLKSALDDVRDDMGEFRASHGSAANSLRKAFKNYLNVEEDLINEECADIIVIVEGNSSLIEKRKRVLDKLAEIGSKERAELDALRLVQKDFAEVKGLELTYSRGIDNNAGGQGGRPAGGGPPPTMPNAPSAPGR